MHGVATSEWHYMLIFPDSTTATGSFYDLGQSFWILASEVCNMIERSRASNSSEVVESSPFVELVYVSVTIVFVSMTPSKGSHNASPMKLLSCNEGVRELQSCGWKERLNTIM